MNRREFAKAITTVLRKHGIKAKLLKSNGSTSPAGSDEAEAYFAIDPKDDRTIKPLFMSFNMDDGKTMKRIVKALQIAHIAYIHTGSEGKCFEFVVYELPRLCKRCKKSHDTNSWVNAICSGCAR